MTLPPCPTQFLAHCKAHKTLTQSQPCKELKMPTHYPPTPADVILLGLTIKHQVRIGSNKGYLIANALFSSMCRLQFFEQMTYKKNNCQKLFLYNYHQL